MAEIGKKLIEGFDGLMRKNVLTTLESAVEEVKQIIIDKYDEELLDIVTDRNSKTNPNLYRDDFIERLDKLTYVEDGNEISIVVPDMETFDFSGRLRVIENIMEGTSGTYVEVNEEDYEAIFNKKPVNADPLDEYVPRKERIYLVRHNNKVRTVERTLKKRFVKYPFSNKQPVDILEVGDEYVEKNMDGWIKNALEKALKEYVKKHKGANI